MSRIQDGVVLQEATVDPVAKPSHSEREETASPPARSACCSSARSLIGLVVIWACLRLVFAAHRGSETDIQASGTFEPGQMSRAGIGALEPKTRLMLPFSLAMGERSPVDALRMITQYVDLTISEDNLAAVRAVDHPARRWNFEETPLYRIIHQLLDNPGQGIGLRGKDLFIIDQRMELSHAEGAARTLTWSGKLPLDAQRRFIMPSGEIDLWMGLRRIEASPDAPVREETIEIEIWKGTNWLAMGRAQLSEGIAQLELSTLETIRLNIARAAQPGDIHHYTVSLDYETH